MIKISGEDLARVCNNAMMFANPKSLYLPGEVLFDLTEGTLKVYACDDYFAICSQAPFTGNAETFFVLNVDMIKSRTVNKEKVEGLEEFARRNKKNEIQITVTDDQSVVNFSSEDETIGYETGPYRENNWYIVEGLIFDPSVKPTSIQTYYSNPERYAKFSQLKYDKEAYGIRWNHVVTETGHLLIRFTVGPDISGVIRPLADPESLKNEETDDGTDSEAPISIPD